jgi:hypothetical protein
MLIAHKIALDPNKVQATYFNTSPPARQVRHPQTVSTLTLTHKFTSAKDVSASQPLPTLLQG